MGGWWWGGTAVLGNESLMNMSEENSWSGNGRGEIGKGGKPELSMEERVARWRRGSRHSEGRRCGVRERRGWGEGWGAGREAKGVGVREMGEILSRRRWVAPEHARDMEWCRMKEGK